MRVAVQNFADKSYMLVRWSKVLPRRSYGGKRGGPEWIPSLSSREGLSERSKGFSERAGEAFSRAVVPCSQFGPAQPRIVAFEKIPLRLAQQLLVENGSRSAIVLRMSS